MKYIFHLNTSVPYNLNVNSKRVKYGTKTISYLAPEIWSLVLEIMKSSKSLDDFKSKVGQWKSDCAYVRLACNHRNIKIHSMLQHINFI